MAVRCPECGTDELAWSKSAGFKCAKANTMCKPTKMHIGDHADNEIWISQAAAQAMLAGTGRYQVTSSGQIDLALVGIIRRLLDWKDNQKGMLADLLEEARTVLGNSGAKSANSVVLAQERLDSANYLAQYYAQAQGYATAKQKADLASWYKQLQPLTKSLDSESNNPYSNPIDVPDKQPKQPNQITKGKKRTK